MRTKFALLALVACQLAMLFGSVSPVSWWDGS